MVDKVYKIFQDKSYIQTQIPFSPPSMKLFNKVFLVCLPISSFRRHVRMSPKQKYKRECWYQCPIDNVWTPGFTEPVLRYQFHKRPSFGSSIWQNARDNNSWKGLRNCELFGKKLEVLEMGNVRKSDEERFF